LHPAIARRNERHSIFSIEGFVMSRILPLSSRALFSASALALALAASPALAQPVSTEAAQQDEQPGPDQDGEPQGTINASDAPAGQDEVIVSGTRIRTPQYDFANPVVSVDDDAIERSGITNITSFLTEFPALVGSSDSNDGSGTNAGIGGVGLNLLDLRNLGTQRTLVLIDGRRHVAAVPGSSSIDTNTIPVELIQRVDIVTGGAGAIYGADAVSGAVNFILRRDFEGITFRGQAGISDEGDGESQFLGLTAGTNFANGRGNVAVSFEYGHDDRFLREQRRRLDPRNFFTFVDNLADQAAGDNPNVPDLIPVTDVRYFDSNPAGAIDVDLDFVPDFIGSGAPFDPGTYVGSIFQTGGSGTPVATYGGELLPTIDRYVGNLLLSYRLTDDIRFYAQGKYARVESASEGQPTFDFTLLVPLDNPFIPANVEAAARAAVGDFGLLVSRDNLDIGRRGEDNVRETYRGVIGFDGNLNPDITFDVSYVYGRSDNEIRQTRTRFNDRFFAAIDAVDEGEFRTGTPNGNIVCRSNIAPATLSNQPFYNFVSNPFDFGAQPLSFTPGPNSGCVPFNLFSEQQRPGAIEFLLTDAVDRSTIEQHVATASLSGTFGQNIRLWGDPIGFAIGAEYRHESSESLPDPVNTTGLTFGNALFPEIGSFDVREAFAELRVPIVADRPFFHELTLNGAARYADYSTTGGALTYQFGGVWAPIRDIRFRGTYAQAVRAPNIGELFGPQNQTFLFIDDPCAPDNINDGTATRAANCQALFTQLGLSPAQVAAFTGDTSASIPGVAGGNPNLREETAETFTAGVIIRPRFIPGLTLSADFYDVKIQDAVSTPSLSTVATLCVDAPTIDNVFCDAIDRNPGTNAAAPGVVSGFRLLPQNVAQFTTKGIDFSASYRFRPGGNLGTVTLGLVGNYLDELTFIATPGGNVIDSTGTVNAPEWQLNFDLNWTIEQLSFTYGFNYFSETLRFSRAQIAADPDIVAPEFLSFSERFTHDMQIAYNINDRFRFYVGVNNLFDQEPDVGATFYPVSAIGRFYYAGVRTSLGGLLD
jgi:iron complex outermembrane recepter protein